MSKASGQWDDLAVRLASGGVIAAVGLAIIWWGGLPFQVLCAAVAGIMVWELAKMLRGERLALPMAALSALAVLAAGLVPSGFLLPLLMLPAILGLGLFPVFRVSFGLFSGGILLASFGLLVLRQDYGFIWILWLVLVVMASDVLGYFAGRMLGGPKFWPRVSPKKTWSGTVAGWVGAALVGLAFMETTAAGPQLIGISVAVAMAGQMGDIAESAVKRRSGVKDSSGLIPGHGGLFDRFDALLGASIFLLIVGRLVGFPPGTG